jgi:hypothetical protein
MKHSVIWYNFDMLYLYFHFISMHTRSFLKDHKDKLHDILKIAMITFISSKYGNH